VILAGSGGALRIETTVVLGCQSPQYVRPTFVAGASNLKLTRLFRKNFRC
jgi:hypothetical protein